METTKICSCCKKEKEIVFFSLYDRWYKNRCMECASAYSSEYRRKNIAKYKAYDKKKHIKRKLLRANSPELQKAYREYHKKYEKHSCEILKDWYVRKKLVHRTPGINCHDIPQVIVEIKRLQIQLKRLKQQKEGKINERG